MSVGTGLSKVDKLRIAGAMAPAVRRGNARRVTLVDKAGKPVRQATFDEIQVALLKREEIEFSLRDDAPQTVCAGWEGPCPKKAKPGKEAFRPGKIASRGGLPWRCILCAQHRSQAFRTPESRRLAGIKAAAAMTPQQRHDRAVARQASLSKERRVEVARVAGAASRAVTSARTPERRSEIASKRAEAMAPQRRSEIAHKIWATRRAKAGCLPSPATCHMCPNAADLSTKSKRDAFKKSGRAYCSPECMWAFRKARSSETMAATNRKHGSARHG